MPIVLSVSWFGGRLCSTGGTFVGPGVSKSLARVESGTSRDAKGYPGENWTREGSSAAGEPRQPIRHRKEDEDWDIVQEVQRGETERFSLLVRKHQDRVFSVVVRILQSPADAEEIVNDAFVAAYRKIKSFRGDARFS